ncbi:hypothetical protein NFI96_003835 [Prochilodus magdalenae]|nr:hypothetical protein NFI96_003835 [Prochilodus magdalenae]
MLNDVAGGITFSTASPEPVTSVTCAQVNPALICEKHKAPVADLSVLVFYGKCQSSSTVLAIQFLTANNDPCNNYTALDEPWRASDETSTKSKCDGHFDWTGWYRLLYYGKDVRMPESCVDSFRCGTDITLWLNGSHPQISDGIVTCRVCGNSGSDCCYYNTTQIRVKACPGNYYVYELVNTNIHVAGYCADIGTIISISPTSVPISTTANWTSSSTSTPGEITGKYRCNCIRLIRCEHHPPNQFFNHCNKYCYTRCEHHPPNQFFNHCNKYCYTRCEHHPPNQFFNHCNKYCYTRCEHHPPNQFFNHCNKYCYTRCEHHPSNQFFNHCNKYCYTRCEHHPSNQFFNHCNKYCYTRCEHHPSNQFFNHCNKYCYTRCEHHPSNQFFNHCNKYCYTRCEHHPPNQFFNHCNKYCYTRWYFNSW